ncbi:hypothetical protein D1872_312410 [compost metagenome]
MRIPANLQVFFSYGAPMEKLMQICSFFREIASCGPSRLKIPAHLHLFQRKSRWLAKIPADLHLFAHERLLAPSRDNETEHLERRVAGQAYS